MREENMKLKDVKDIKIPKVNDKNESGVIINSPFLFNSGSSTNHLYSLQGKLTKPNIFKNETREEKIKRLKIEYDLSHGNGKRKRKPRKKKKKTYHKK